MKGLPNWYGIDGIGFEFLNTQTDPLIEYKGRKCSCYIVEDTMWERFREDYGASLKAVPEDIQERMFGNYMRENAEEVKYLCEIALFPETA